jgi:hypothetical protein
MRSNIDNIFDDSRKIAIQKWIENNSLTTQQQKDEYIKKINQYKLA